MVLTVRRFDQSGTLRPDSNRESVECIDMVRMGVLIHYIAVVLGTSHYINRPPPVSSAELVRTLLSVN